MLRKRKLKIVLLSEEQSETLRVRLGTTEVNWPVEMPSRQVTSQVESGDA